MSHHGASGYPDKWDCTSALLSREWAVSLKKCIRLVLHSLLNLGLWFILLVFISLKEEKKKREKEGSKWHRFLSQSYTCALNISKEGWAIQPLCPSCVHGRIYFLQASHLLLSQDESPWLSQNCLQTPWHSFTFLLFLPSSLHPFLPPSSWHKENNSGITHVAVVWAGLSHIMSKKILIRKME